MCSSHSQKEKTPFRKPLNENFRKQFKTVLDIIDHNRSSSFSRGLNEFIRSRSFPKKGSKKPNPFPLFLYPLSLTSSMVYKWYTIIPFRSMKTTFKTGIFSGRKRIVSSVRKTVSHALTLSDSVFLHALSEYFSSLRYVYKTEEYNRDIASLKELSFRLMKEEIKNVCGEDLEERRKQIVRLLSKGKPSAGKLLTAFSSEILDDFEKQFPKLNRSIDNTREEIKESSLKSAFVSISRLYFETLRAYLEISIKEEKRKEKNKSLKRSHLEKKKQLRELALLYFSLYYLFSNYFYFSKQVKKREVDVSNLEEPIKKRKSFSQVASRIFKSKLFKYLLVPFIFMMLSFYGFNYFITHSWQSAVRNKHTLLEPRKGEDLYVPVPDKVKKNAKSLSAYTYRYYSTIEINSYSLHSILARMKNAGILSNEGLSIVINLDSEIRREKDYMKQEILKSYRDNLLMLMLVIYTKRDLNCREKEMYNKILKSAKSFLSSKYKINSSETLTIMMTNLSISLSKLVSSYDTRLIKALYKRIDELGLPEDEKMKIIYFIKEKRRDSEGTWDSFIRYFSRVDSALYYIEAKN